MRLHWWEVMQMTDQQITVCPESSLMPVLTGRAKIDDLSRQGRCHVCTEGGSSKHYFVGGQTSLVRSIPNLEKDKGKECLPVSTKFPQREFIFNLAVLG